MLGTNKTFILIVGLGVLLITLGYIIVNMPQGTTDRSGQTYSENIFSSESEAASTSSENSSAQKQQRIGDSAKENRSTVNMPITDDANSGKSGIATNIENLNGKKAGDAITVFIPQESLEYVGMIEEVERNPSGSQSLVGKFIAGPETYRFVFTTGKGYTFGTLHTPEGRYQYQALNGEGRLVSGIEINAKRDFSQPDYIIPEQVVRKKRIGAETKR